MGAKEETTDGWRDGWMCGQMSAMEHKSWENAEKERERVIKDNKGRRIRVALNPKLRINVTLN